MTDGGFLELVNEFEVEGGGYVDPHSHPTHEFYYVLRGRGIMTIGDEDRLIAQGDLVHIPPDVVHSLRPVTDHAPIHCFCFAIGVKGAGPHRLHQPLTAHRPARVSPPVAGPSTCEASRPRSSTVVAPPRSASK